MENSESSAGKQLRLSDVLAPQPRRQLTPLQHGWCSICCSSLPIAGANQPDRSSSGSFPALQSAKPGTCLNIVPGCRVHDCGELLLALALSQSTSEAPKPTVPVDGF